MLKYLSLIIALACTHLMAQEVQWASRLLEFSSEFKYDKHPGQYEAAQALGPPSIMPNSGAHPCAWSPSAENSGVQFMKVAFATPTQAQQIVINENFNPGTITSIYLFDEKDKAHKIYGNLSPGPVNETGRLFRYTFDRTNYKVTALRVELSTYLVPGFNQIDAIGIADSKDPVEVRINLAKTQTGEEKAENLGPAINSEYDELCPVISPDGKSLYFTRFGHPDNLGAEVQQDVWMSLIGSNGSFNTAQNLGAPINTDFNNSMLSITPDGQTALLLNVYLPDGNSDKGVSISQKEGTQWGQPQALKIEDYYNNNQYGEYFLTADGQTLIMTLQRDDSEGSKDLYVSFLKEDGTWTAPRHMGPLLNTAASEISPFLAADGTTLYFASAGFPGYGSSDMFVTRRLDDSWTRWTEPQNLGPVVNSPNFDAYYSLPASGDYAYFMSYENSMGKGDLFRLKLPAEVRPNPVVLIHGRVLNAKTREPLSADILYESLDRQVQIGEARSNSEDGSYSIVLPAGEAYGFLAKAKGFASVSENIDLSDLENYQEIEQDLLLAPLEAGQIIRLNNVFFDFDKASLRPETSLELSRLIQLLEDNPDLQIKIGGHTDDRGDAAYNRNLSRNRAKAVADYLVEKGVKQERLQWEGYGESKPVADNQSPEGRQMNRRVEFEILKN